MTIPLKYSLARKSPERRASIEADARLMIAVERADLLKRLRDKSIRLEPLLCKQAADEIERLLRIIGGKK